MSRESERREIKLRQAVGAAIPELQRASLILSEVCYLAPEGQRNANLKLVADLITTAHKRLVNGKS